MASDIPNNTNYEVGSAVVTAYPYTMAIWFYVATTTANRVLMDMGSTTADSGQYLAANSSGTVEMQPRVAGSGTITTTTTSYTANTWHHAAVVYASATDRRVFLDGGGKATSAVNRAFAATIDRTLIGRRLRTNVYSSSINGRLAEAGLWSAALSDDEVYALSRGYRPSLIRTDSLVLYVPMVRSVQDLAGGETLTTVGGTPAVIEHPRRIG